MILLDPEIQETNFILKEGLKENEDFLILSEPFWKFLYKRYNGIPIKRHKITSDDNTRIEIHYKKVPTLDSLIFKLKILILPIELDISMD